LRAEPSLLELCRAEQKSLNVFLKIIKLYSDLPLFKDVYQLILKIFDYTYHFPREYKFTLRKDLKRDGINLARSIYKISLLLQLKLPSFKYLENSRIFFPMSVCYSIILPL